VGKWNLIFDGNNGRKLSRETENRMTHNNLGITSKTFLLLMKTFNSYPEIEEVEETQR